MTRGQRVHLACCAALIGWALGYAIPAYSRLPNLFYDPVARGWLVAGRPGPVQMGYYGQMLWGMAGGLIAGGAVWMFAGMRKRPPTESTLSLAAAWALTFLGLIGLYFTWQNWP